MFYNLMVWCSIGLAKLIAPFDKKTKLFVKGRSGLLSRLQKSLEGNKEKIIWVHCASLGEFEQGLPVMEALKQQVPQFKILLTFFSPSGHEVRKNYKGADFILYLPYDLPRPCRKFISIVKPSMAIFIKYEFWPNLFRELRNQNIHILSVSSIFRGDQIYFKLYGGMWRRTLSKVDHFFVQNRQSIDLLKGIGFTNVTHSGDTRFDRVFNITENKREIEIAKRFKGNARCWVIGSCWPEDFEVLSHFINEDKGQTKFIIAPHEIDNGFIDDMVESLEVKSVRYSQATAKFEDYSVLIIDNIGMLSQLYRYGDFGYVGGGLGKGLHNVLEAACYGIPVFFGNKNYDKFQEANDLIAHGGGFAVGSYVELKSTYQDLISYSENYKLACSAAKNYVEMNLGATQKVVTYCVKLLEKK